MQEVTLIQSKALTLFINQKSEESKELMTLQ